MPANDVQEQKVDTPAIKELEPLAELLVGMEFVGSESGQSLQTHMDEVRLLRDGAFS
jgi:hypothetical protein